MLAADASTVILVNIVNRALPFLVIENSEVNCLNLSLVLVAVLWIERVSRCVRVVYQLRVLLEVALLL